MVFDNNVKFEIAGKIDKKIKKQIGGNEEMDDERDT